MRLRDLGCGEGLFTGQLKLRLPRATTILAVDLVADESWAKATPGIHFVVGDAASPPVGAERPDGVIAKDLLHHMDDPVLRVQAIIRTARRRAVIIEANRENPIMDMYTRINGDRHLTTGELKDLLERASPTVTWRISSTVAYPFYVPPVRTVAALWVWPLTAVMLLSFKVVRRKVGARELSRVIRRLDWPAPHTEGISELGLGGSGPSRA